MEIKLLRLIYDYSIKGKLVDKNYIEKFVEFVVNSKSLNKYVCGLQILPEKKGRIKNGMSLASYRPFSKTICVYTNGINEMLKRKERYKVLFNDVEQIFYKNLIISQIILHELEHANQRKIIDNEKGLEPEILKLSAVYIDFNIRIKLIEAGYSIEEIKIYFLSKNAKKIENYKKNYLIAPEERLAQIKSYQEILDLLSHIKEYVPNLIEFEQTNKIENLLRGFDYDLCYISSPTISYLHQNGNSQALKRFDWYDENYLKCLEKSKDTYSLVDRLKYGLMIDENEFDRCTEIIKLSKKYNC